MSIKAFISYSHRDEKWLDLLHRHLAMLRHEGLIELWFDKQIEAGGRIDGGVSDALDESQLFLALVSPDFLNSNYCYEKEMAGAMDRATDGTIRIVPIILEPCDWKSSPLAQFKALPKDGTPVSLWANPNVAMLDVVTEIRKLLTADVTPPDARSPASEGQPPKRRMRVKRDFDTIDIADFRDAAFGVIRDYFQSSCGELNQIGDTLRARFEFMSATAFTCTVVNRAKRDGDAHITVHNEKSRRLGDITYSFNAHGEEGTANGMIDVRLMNSSCS